MQLLYPQAFFATPGGITVFIAVMLVEVFSLAYFGITVWEYRLLRRRHIAFFRVIGGEEHREHSSFIILWVYVVFTIIITLVTSVIFIFQPHLL